MFKNSISLFNINFFNYVYVSPSGFFLVTFLVFSKLLSILCSFFNNLCFSYYWFFWACHNKHRELDLYKFKKISNYDKFWMIFFSGMEDAFYNVDLVYH